MLQAVERKSLSDAVFEQLRARIVAGEIGPGEALPSERVLCETLQVNRGALREALKRLEQARLVSIRHGGATRVLDFRRAAGPELLAQLLLTPEGAPDGRVVRGIAEMRAALAPDIARLAARRGGAAVAEELDALAREMAEARGDLAAVQDASSRFWDVLVRAADNIAYRLVYNTLRDTYDRIRAEVRALLAADFRSAAPYRAIAAAVRAGDERAAERAARRLFAESTAELARLADRLAPAERSAR